MTTNKVVNKINMTELIKDCIVINNVLSIHTGLQVEKNLCYKHVGYVPGDVSLKCFINYLETGERDCWAIDGEGHGFLAKIDHSAIKDIKKYASK